MTDTQYAPYGALILRIALGVMWITHGLLKLLVFGLPGTAQFFASVGFASWLAYPIVAAEILGGIVILAGFYGRFVSLVFLPILAGAFFVHLSNGWVFSNVGGGWEYPLFLMVASLAHALNGDGALALSQRLPNLFRLQARVHA